MFDLIIFSVPALLQDSIFTSKSYSQNKQINVSMVKDLTQML